MEGRSTLFLALGIPLLLLLMIVVAFKYYSAVEHLSKISTADPEMNLSMNLRRQRRGTPKKPKPAHLTHKLHNVALIGASSLAQN